MKSKLFWLFLMCILVPIKVFPQEDAFIEDFLERWDNSKKYLIDLAEAMPEEAYHTKPYPEAMTFAEQLMHIAVVVDWHAFSKFDGREIGLRWEDFTIDGKSKEELISITEKEFERARQLIATFDPKRLEEKGEYAQFTRSRRQFLLLLADHVSHHRGQLVVYLRLRGIEPPNYINYQ
jgi:uncharacterized damage-inducible protein DinB